MRIKRWIVPKGYSFPFTGNMKFSSFPLPPIRCLRTRFSIFDIDRSKTAKKAPGSEVITIMALMKATGYRIPSPIRPFDRCFPHGALITPFRFVVSLILGGFLSSFGVILSKAFSRCDLCGFIRFPFFFIT